MLEADRIEITVCAACLRARCWQGEFMCDKARGAGITTRFVEELEGLDLENPEWWAKDAGLNRRQCQLLESKAERLNALRRASPTTADGGGEGTDA